MDYKWLYIINVLGTLHAFILDKDRDVKVEQQQSVFRTDDDDPFIARNCNGEDTDTAILVLNYMTIKPFPIQLGHVHSINISFTLKQDIGVGNNKIEIDLGVWLITPWGHTDVCNYAGDEFCHTNNLCTHIEKFKNNCPSKIPKCTCPVLKGTYVIENLFVPIAQLPFELNAPFEVGIHIKEQGRHLGCVESHFCIGRCRPLPD